MIIYFSGTGNSRYTARRLAGYLGEEAVDIARNPDVHPEAGMRMLGIVSPVYAWGIPAPVMEWISCQRGKCSVPLIWGVLTCGDETGRAPDMLARQLRKAGLQLDAVYSVQMPNNYVLLPGFDVDAKELERRKLEACEDRIRQIAKSIERGERGVDDVVRGPWARLKTGLVYPLFRRWGISERRWKVDTSKCVSCYKCQMACSVGNITLDRRPDLGDERYYPVWHDKCVSCLGCYHVCPQKAISYGKATLRKGHYYNKKSLK